MIRAYAFPPNFILYFEEQRHCCELSSIILGLSFRGDSIDILFQLVEQSLKVMLVVLDNECGPALHAILLAFMHTDCSPWYIETV